MNEETLTLPLADNGKVWIPEDSKARKQRLYDQVRADVTKIGKELKRQILLFSLPAIPLIMFGVVAIIISKWAFLVIAGGILITGAVMGLRLYLPIFKRYQDLQRQVKAWR